MDLKKLNKMKVYDKDGVESGNIIDFIFTNDYKLSKFILGGSRIEEFKEKIGLKDDDDPVISIENIESIDPNKHEIKLKVKNEELPNKLQENALSQNETLFSKFRKAMIYSSDNKKVGKIVDAIICEENEVSFILGDNPFIEFLERIGLVGNYDLLLPSRFIEKRENNKIYINKTKMELKILLDNEEVKGKKGVDYSQLNNAQITSQVLKYKVY